ncbi:peptidase domain-containing ABC transporter [Luteithermobacter gelatinilyticus]|uniref:peptidase domain-containing ABC transporter n=1 Tax=Luteithermobacter gelatinilyticus TaxID=2582913 RepID=UPI00143D4EE7|nr:ABC transporter transmembrane domain-containing protein [Luteithermobacter gelatinilyticus]
MTGTGLENLGFMPILRKDILLASLVLNALSLALPMVLLQVYDRIIPNAALNTLTLLIIGLLGVLIIDVLLRSARAYLAGWIGAKFEHDMGSFAVEKILNAELTELEKTPPGVHLDRLSAIDSVRDFYSSQAGLTLVDLPFVFLFLALLGIIGGSLLVVPVLLLLLLGALAFVLGVRLRDAIEKDAIWEDRRYSFIIEVLNGIHSIKSLAMEHLMNRRYEKLMESCSAASYSVIYLNGLAQSLGNIFSQITMIAVVSIGSLMVIDSQMTIGALAASTLLAGRTVQPLLRALGIWTRFQHIQIAKDKLDAITHLPQERPTKTTEPAKDLIEVDRIDSISLKNLSFRYTPNAPLILENVSLDIRRGDIIGIRGGNGAGKSTLLWALMGGLTPQQGEILINGHPPEAFTTESLRQKIAYLPQKPVMFRGTILDNLTMFRGDEHIDAALKVAEMLNLNSILARLPDGYETQIGDGAENELPTGIAQRIAIARTLAWQPDVILFDEANSGLDNQSDEDLINVMTSLKGVSTMVLVSYRPSLLKLADKLYDLNKGHLTLSSHRDEKTSGPAPKKGEHV